MPKAQIEKVRRLLRHNLEMDWGDWASGSAPCSMVIEVGEASLSRVVLGSVPVDGRDRVGVDSSVSLLEGVGVRSVSFRVSNQSVYWVRIPSSTTCSVT